MPKKTIIIDHMNTSGDGVAYDGSETILAAFALPGETIEASWEKQSHKGPIRATMTRLVTPSAHRQQAPCPYFESCGGCQLQHLQSDAYKLYKKQIVIEAFRSHAITSSILDPVIFGPHLKRRTNFKAIKKGSSVALGYHQRRSHHVLDIDACLLLKTEFNILLSSLKQVLSLCLENGQECNIFLTKVSEGFDGHIILDQKKELSPEERKHLIHWAQTQGVVRLTVKTLGQDNLLIHQVSPSVSFGEISVSYPPHAFLQSSVEAETYMVQILESLLPKKCKRILDLFSGLGTFTFPLSRYGRVDAIEQNQKAVHHLNVSAHQSGLSHCIQGMQRDLFKHPLSASELGVYDVVVLDPPRAGAVQQIKILSQSSVKKIIMISCNAHTFARDAYLLRKEGYDMSSTHLIDQFLWSPHIELMASFSKGEKVA